MSLRRTSVILMALLLGATVAAGGHSLADGRALQKAGAALPIQHLVVIFEENKSFDNYFSTYPVAANRAGEPPFVGAVGTPAVNGLTDTLLNHNPNLVNPFRIDRSNAFTCYVNNGYDVEQQAANQGLLNRFVESTSIPPKAPLEYCPQSGGNYVTPMGYYDGNTVTALWNYAQHFAMSDNSFGSTFGQSTIGALNLVAGDTSGILCGPQKSVSGTVPACGSTDEKPPNATNVPAPAAATTGTLYVDTDPYWDACSDPKRGDLTASSRRNLGDLLTAGGVSWGWFQGGFAQATDGGCNADQHAQVSFDQQNGIDPASDPNVQPDYIPHHEPFQYFSSTANPQHLPPLSPLTVGKDDRANHQYDLSNFWDAAAAGNVPAVSFFKAPHYQDGHPGESNPIDEQVFLTETLNRLQGLLEWSSMAVVIAWDDSGGWYDHVTGPVLNHSKTPLDLACGETSDGPQARCGYGPRLPLLLISPFAKRNYVSHSLSDQTSVTRLIEDNWLGGQRISAISFDNEAGSLLDLFDFNGTANGKLLLDPQTGEPTSPPVRLMALPERGAWDERRRN